MPSGHDGISSFLASFVHCLSQNIPGLLSLILPNLQPLLRHRTQKRSVCKNIPTSFSMLRKLSYESHDKPSFALLSIFPSASFPGDHFPPGEERRKGESRAKCKPAPYQGTGAFWVTDMTGCVVSFPVHFFESKALCHKYHHHHHFPAVFQQEREETQEPIWQ